MHKISRPEETRLAQLRWAAKVSGIMKKVNNVPALPGVYFLKDSKGRVIYIGKARNLKNRVRSHLQSYAGLGGTRTSLQNKISDISWKKTESEIEALVLESRLIKKYEPKYNILMRDDKQYFFVGFTREDFPRIFITHQPAKPADNRQQPPGASLARGGTTDNKNKNRGSEADYIGPFTDGKAIKKTLRILRGVFPYYSIRHGSLRVQASESRTGQTTKKHPNIKCLYCHIGLCPGPTPKKSEYRKNIRNIKHVLTGKKTTLIKKLEKEMKDTSRKENFEKAAQILDKIVALKNIFQHASVLSPDAIFRTYERKYVRKYENERGLTSFMKKKFKEYLGICLLSKKRVRIEGYDVSNIQGKHATGSMVVFDNNPLINTNTSTNRHEYFGPNRNEYRKFSIRTVRGVNDVAMLKEILKRRFKHSEWDYPDIILIDGGKPQLNAALEAVRLYSYKAVKPSVIAIAKQDEEIYVPERKNPIRIPKSSLLLLLLMHVRDEAHRFAVGYHRKLHRRTYRGIQ